MTVVWAWAFLDLATETYDEQLAFWQRVTRSSLSTRRGDHDEFLTLLPGDGDPWVKVQRIDGPDGVHVDLEVTDISSATRAALGLGARVVQDLGTLVVCTSPGGLAFCLVAAPADGPSTQVRAGAPSLLDQVCLDIPAEGYAAELAFWTGLTGWPASAAAPGDSGLLPLTRPPGIPLRLLTQRTGEPHGAVRAHVDVACLDRADETRLHVEAGAAVESVHERWTVLRAPGGRRYCLTDRDPRTSLLA